MLAVINAAWRTRTRIPGVNPEKFIGLPKRSNICAFSETVEYLCIFRDVELDDGREVAVSDDSEISVLPVDI